MRSRLHPKLRAAILEVLTKTANQALDGAEAADLQAQTLTLDWKVETNGGLRIKVAAEFPNIREVVPNA